MKNNFNGYERMLNAYLKRYHFAEAEDNKFITARADNALDVFCDARRRGLDVICAEELAIQTLMQDFDLSLDDVVRGILSKDFADRLPEYEYDVFMAHIEDALEEYRERYQISYEFMETEEGRELEMELINLIDENLYGL